MTNRSMADPDRSFFNAASRHPAAKDARYAVLDIGSNSIRLVIYDIFGASFTPIYNEKVLAGLGRSLRETGALDPKGKDQARQALSRFQLITKAQKVDRLIIGATAALREARDAAAFLAEIKAETGLDIRPISGTEEARISAMGLLAAQPHADGIAADLGGASLELIRVGPDKSAVIHQPQMGLSLPIGPFQILGHDLRAADFDPSALKATLRQRLAGSEFADLNPTGQTLYLIGGAWRNLSDIHQQRANYPLRVLQSYGLATDEAQTIACWAYGPGREDVMNWPNISAKRAETLPYGALLLDLLIEVMQPSSIIVSATGLREGLIYDAIGPDQRQRDALHDGCRDLATGNLSSEGFADPLYHFLTQKTDGMSQTLFDVQTTDKIELGVFDAQTEARILYAACLLTGIGKGRHRQYRARLVFDDILYAPIAGLTHTMRAYLALILYRSFTNAAHTPNDPAIEQLLSLKARRSAHIYGTAIRLAVVASGRSATLLSDFTLSVTNGQAKLHTKDGSEVLLTRRVTHRLNKLNAALQSKG